MSELANIDHQLAAERNNLTRAQELYDETAAKLAASAGDKALTASLENVEGDLARHERNIKRLEAARRHAAKAQTVEDQAATLARKREALAALEKTSRAIAATARKADTALDTLLSALAEMDQLHQAAAHASYDAGWTDAHRLNFLSLRGVSASIASRLKRSGLVNKLTFLDVTGSPSTPLSCTDVAMLNNDKMVAGLQHAVPELFDDEA